MKKHHRLVQFKEYTCEAHLEPYERGGTCIQLVSAKDDEILDVIKGEPIATATAWVENVGQGYVAIKSYAENKGMLRSLINAGLISEPTAHMQSGYVALPICKLLISPE